MAIIVQKYGGTSVANIDLIKNTAKKIIAEIQQGNKVIVVVSAMAGETNKLVSFANQISKLTTKEELAEYDVVVSAGEQVTSGLLALELIALGKKARSWQAWQLPIISDEVYGNANISYIDNKKLLESVANDEIPIIAGFQGCNQRERVTTFGRGGSDTSAIAIAAAVGAERCDIYTDVDGVYDVDPKIVPEALKLDKISYEEMLEMALMGSKILHSTSVEIAMKYSLPVTVLSSLSNKAGTMLVKQDQTKDQKPIMAISHSENDVKITLDGIPDQPGSLAALFDSLKEANITPELISQNITDQKASIVFTIDKQNLNKIIHHLENKRNDIKYQNMTIDDNVAKISVIGFGVRSNKNITTKLFSILAEKEINIMLFAIFEIKVIILISAEHLLLAIKTLHAELKHIS
jgi:aspartate kinase